LATGNEWVEQVQRIAADEGAKVVVVSAQVESELIDLSEVERIDYLATLGVKEGGLQSLIKATYELLGLYTYLTTGPQETRAWTIQSGTKAPQAAGVIHSDFERGFIRAETITYQDLVAAGSMAAAKEKGLVRSEGKDYVVQEGDVMLFRFNV
jgi:ribosome-binding ATPase YchF (GTP1/OBG family)